MRMNRSSSGEAGVLDWAKDATGATAIQASPATTERRLGNSVVGPAQVWHRMARLLWGE
jgi:hypothetical protein